MRFMEHIVELDKLEIGRHSFEFQLDSTYFEGIENTELLGGDVAVKAELNLRSSSFALHVWVEGVVQVTCDHCLDCMDQPVKADDDMEIEPEAKTLDLDWLAYELIVINLPLVHCHQSGGCNPEMDALLQSHLCCPTEDPETL